MTFPFMPFPNVIQSIYSIKGFITGGGNSPGVSALYTTTEKITFATDTMSAASGAAVAVGRYALNGESTPTKGFTFGGNTTNSTVFNTTPDRFDFATETDTQVAGAALTFSVLGYATSGNMAQSISQGSASANKTSYATETSATSTAILGQSRYALNSGGGGRGSKAFVFGGFTGSVMTATADRITYATEASTIVAGAALNAIRANVASAYNDDSTYAMGGGATGGVVFSTVQKVPFATETISTPASATLPDTRINGMTTGSNTKGYYCGGSNASAISNLGFRLTYATDTTAAIASANLAAIRSQGAGI